MVAREEETEIGGGKTRERIRNETRERTGREKNRKGKGKEVREREVDK
jgi:hypothetical protein